jgi:hypothetical protein
MDDGMSDDSLASAVDGGPPVSESEQVVTFSTFDGTELRNLREIREGHVPEDPRLDPYITKLHRFFQSSDRRKVIYIPSRRSLLPFAFRMRRVLRGSDGKIADANYIGHGMAVLLSLLFVAALILMRRRQLGLGWIIAGYLPWLPVIILGGFFDLSSFFLLYVGWYWIFEQGRSYWAHYLLYRYRDPDIHKLKGMFLYLVGAFFLSLAFRFPMENPGRELLFLLLPLIGDFGILLLWGLVRLFVQYHVNHHPVFLPIPLRKENQRETLRMRYLLLAALPIVLFPFLSQIKTPARRIELPVPIAVPSAHGYDWDTLRRLWENPVSGDLPDLADYLAHAAYQSGLSYGVTFHLPQPGEEVEIPVFTEDVGEDRITKSAIAVMVFGDTWLAEQMARPAPGSVPRMILDQPGAIDVETQPLSQAIKVLPWWRSLGIIFFAVFVLIGFDFIATPVLSYVGKIQISRKNRWAA